MERHKPPSEVKKLADELKKQSEVGTIYTRPDDLRSCDKPDHAQRSLANDPTHTKHWGKNPPK